MYIIYICMYVCMYVCIYIYILYFGYWVCQCLVDIYLKRIVASWYAVETRKVRELLALGEVGTGCCNTNTFDWQSWTCLFRKACSTIILDLCLLPQIIAGVSRSVTVPLLATLLAEAVSPDSCLLLVLQCCVFWVEHLGKSVRQSGTSVSHTCKDCQASSLASSADLQLSYNYTHLYNLDICIIIPI